MPDRRRIVTLSPGGRPIVELDLEQADAFISVAESFFFEPGPKRQQRAGRGGRTGGGHVVGEDRDLARFGWTALVAGSSADQVNQRVEQLLTAVESAARGRLFEWRPDGATRSSYLRIAGPGEWKPAYKWVEYAGANLLPVEISWPCHPLVEWDRMTIGDDFSVDSIADYTFDAGAGTLSVTGGQLVPSSTALKQLYHAARGYSYADAQATLKFTPGAVGGTVHLLLRRVDANNALMLQAQSGVLRIRKLSGGGDVALAGGVVTPAWVAGTPVWLRFRVEGSVLTAEFWSAPPTPAGAPAGTLPYTLTAAEQAIYTTGPAGLRITPGGTDERYDDFAVEPYTRRALTLPDLMPLAAVPGTAPAKADLVVTPSGGAAAPVWALAGWAVLAEPYNEAWNGHFEENVNGWFTSGDTLGTGGGVFTRDTTQAKYGSGSGKLVADAVTEGVRWPSYRRFKKGVTHTVKFWAKTDTGTLSTDYYLRGDGGVDQVSGGATLTTAWQELSLTITPTADRDLVHFSIRALAAGTFFIDGVRIYEGTVEPTLYTQTEGRGAVPPLGIIEAESCDTGDLAGWAVTADAGSRGGHRLARTVAGAETLTAAWVVDPSLLVADDFTDAELDLELYAVVDIASTLVSPKLTVSVRPLDGLDYGAERFTRESGSAGKLMTKPASGTAKRVVRLGTITLPVDRERPRAHKLWLTGNTAAGSSGIFAVDYLAAVPARARALGPTGKANDTSYPRFVRSTAETTKRVRHDLVGETAKPPSHAIRDHGLGGNLIELPPGDAQLLVKLSSLVPDDPTSDVTTEQLAHTATVHVDVTPRSWLLRPA